MSSSRPCIAAAPISFADEPAPDAGPQTDIALSLGWLRQALSEVTA